MAYLTHSGHLVLLPLHLLTSAFLPGQAPIHEQLNVLRGVLRHRFRKSDTHSTSSSGRTRRAWTARLAWTGIKLSVLSAVPSCGWYLASSLTSMTAITSIFNSFAFWAYLLSIKMLGEPPSAFKLGSVVLSTVGVLVISLGGAAVEGSVAPAGGSSPLVGDLLALGASLSFAYYEVW